MSFSVIEREGSDIKLAGITTAFNQLGTCVVRRPATETRVFGTIKSGYRLPGNGSDVLISIPDVPVTVHLQSTPNTADQVIGTIFWE